MLDKNFERYINYLRKLREEKFTGEVTVKFFKGGISKSRIKFDPIAITEKDIIFKGQRSNDS